MIFEQVNFNEETVKAMSRDEFIRRHVDILWTDKDKAIRKKMLGQAYQIIKGAEKAEK